MEIRLFKVHPCSMEQTKANATFYLYLPNLRYHTMIRIVDDGTCYLEYVKGDLIYTNIAYNVIFRFDEILVVDNIIVFIPKKYTV